MQTIEFGMSVVYYIAVFAPSTEQISIIVLAQGSDTFLCVQLNSILFEFY
jgi:hypothetical protein